MSASLMMKTIFLFGNVATEGALALDMDKYRE